MKKGVKTRSGGLYLRDGEGGQSCPQARSVRGTLGGRVRYVTACPRPEDDTKLVRPLLYHVVMNL